MKLNKLIIYSLCLMFIGPAEVSCRAKPCPSYLEDTPKKKRFFKRHKKNTKNGLFSRKQRRYY